VLFALLPLAFAGLKLLDTAYGPLFDDPHPGQPDAPDFVVFVAGLLLLAMLFLPFVGLALAVLGLFQRDHKPWAALLGMGLFGSLFLWWFAGAPLPWA
jgi:hypothetical protein